MNQESLHSYDILPTEHELVKHYHPKFVAKGGDHLVYEVADHPEVVVKASTFTIKDIIAHNIEQGVTPDALPETMLGWSGEEVSPKEEVVIKNKQIIDIRRHFGHEHTLKERRYLMKVPVTKELLEAVFTDDFKKRKLSEEAENLKEVWSTVVVQEKSGEISDPGFDHKSLNFGNFVEERKGSTVVDSVEYNKLNEALIKGIGLGADTIERFLRVQDNSEGRSLTKIIIESEIDPELKEVLRGLVKKMIVYAQQTGNILALAGKDNLILFKKDGKWDYLLVDVLPVHTEPVFKVAQDTIHQIANDQNPWEGKTEDLVRYEKSMIMKAYNFTRLVNGLAVCLGIQDHLELISPEDVSTRVDLNKIIQ